MKPVLLLQQLAVFVTTVVWIIAGAAEAGPLDKFRDYHGVYTDLETFSGDKKLYNVTTTRPSNVSLTTVTKKKNIDVNERKLSLRLEASTGFNGFVAPLWIGDTEAPFMVAFDTGSSNTWLYSISSEDLEGSSDDSPDGVRYLDGSQYDGTLVTADFWVNIGLPPPAEQQRVLLEGVVVLAVTTWGNPITGLSKDKKMREAIDGVVGLAPSRMKTSGFLQILEQKGVMGKSHYYSFSFYVSASGKTGEIMFGGHNNELLHKRHKMVYIQQQEVETLAWSLQFERLGLAGGSANLVAGTGIERQQTTAMLMTRLPLAFYMPYRLFLNLVKEEHYPDASIVCDEEAKIYDPGMRFQQGRQHDCRNWFSLIIKCRLRKRLKNLVMEIGEHKFTFTGKEVFPRVIAEEGKYRGMCSSFFGYMPPAVGEEEYKGDYFYPAKDEEGSDATPPYSDDLWAIGVGFMKKYYIEYRQLTENSDTREIGIGLSKGKEIVEKKNKRGWLRKWEKKKRNSDEGGGDKKKKKRGWGLRKWGKKKKKEELGVVDDNVTKEKTVLVVEDDFGDEVVDDVTKEGTVLVVEDDFGDA